MKVIDVSKRYKGKTYALKDANFELKEGVTGLIGRNGSGKTTLMKVMCDIIQKYEGTVEKDNSAIIGYLIEDPKYYKNKSGWYNIHYFGKVLGDNYDRAFVEMIVKKLGMDSYLKRKVKTYSLGMKQKLVLVLSLINKPKYLILDEPTNGMDPDSSIDVLKIIKEIGDELGISVMISSHKLEDIELISDNILFIEKGELSKEISLQNLHSTTNWKFIFHEDDIEAADEIFGEMLGGLYKRVGNTLQFESDGGLSNILQRLGANNIYPDDIEKHTQSLKDYYFNMIGGEY